MPSVKQRALQALTQPGCGRCGTTKGVTQQPCRTQYADPKENESPWLCAQCAEDYHDYWDGMWADYYSGSGVAYVTPEQLKKLRLKEQKH
jgi:hypothetical protein